MKVNILGTDYKFILGADEKEYPDLKDLAGYTDFDKKVIVIRDKDKITLKHEIIHAFLYESGLDSNSEWARNEELIDWIAIQFEKILNVFMELGVITFETKVEAPQTVGLSVEEFRKLTEQANSAIIKGM